MRYAVCNEFFGDMEFAKAAALVAKHGFHGMELAPFTLFGDFSPAAVAAGVRTARKGLADNGLAFAGLHWLFVKPEGLHVTARDAAVRQRSWDHLKRLLDIAGELGGGSLIFGSPKQRSSRGIPKDEAMRYYEEGLAGAADYASARSSRVLVEALPSVDTDIVNTLAEAEAVVARVSRPGVSGMFDFHNTTDETEPWDELLKKHWGMTSHVHVNTLEGGWPTPASAGYDDAFAVLRNRCFAHWVSLEIFSIPDSPETVLADTMAFLRKQTERCG